MRVRSEIKAVAFVVVVQLLLTAYRFLPTQRALLLVLPTAEFAFLMVLAVTAADLRQPWRILMRIAASFILSVLVLFGIGETFYQYIYREAFVPWTDLAYLPAFLNMVFETALFSHTVVMGLLYVASVAFVCVIFFFGIRSVGRSFQTNRRVGLIVVGAICLLSVVGSVLDGERLLVARVVDQLEPPDPTFTSSFAVPEPDDNPFPLLREADLHLVVVESYGHTLFSRSDHWDAIAPSYEAAESRLFEGGHTAYSHFMRSPAFGGRSWLADATLLTGRFIDTQAKYNELVHSDVRNLTHTLGDAGFLRIFAAPGTYQADDYWGRFYRFDHYLFRYDFGYEGPFISFGAMPDQYLLHRAKEFADEMDDGRPQFIMSILVSSHVPFERVPPYVEDWNTMGDGSLFGEIPMIEFDNNWLTGAEFPEGYIASIEYVLRTLTSYITRRLDDDSLVIIVGDHQPREPIAEEGAGYSVPIHAVSRNAELVRQFRHFGFQLGLTPTDVGAHPPMDEFLPMLLSVLQGNAEARARGERNTPR